MPLSSGSRLGPYEILAPLGAGGMGEVYRARDPRLGRDVAIKVIPEAAIADPDRLRRFDQEARAVAALSHPNILAIFDIGLGEIPFLVTELLEGETLRTTLERGPLAVSRAMDPLPATRRRSRRRPLPGHRPSRSQARQHLRHR